MNIARKLRLPAANLAAALLLAAGPAAAALPPEIAAMIRASSGDDAGMKAVVAAAKKISPENAGEIDALVSSIAAEQASAKEERLASQGFFNGWSGAGEAGVSATSGNTGNVGVVVGIGLQKETRQWRHGIDALVDWQRQDGVTTRERYALAYDGNWKFSSRAYAWLLLSAERDRFAGYDRRFTEGVGIGYRLVDSETFRVDLEAGPAFRQTRFITGISQNNLSGRVATNLLWQPGENITLTEAAGAFLESGNSTLTSVTALTFKVSDKVSVRSSFDVRHETEPPLGRVKTDTSTRFTLIYAL